MIIDFAKMIRSHHDRPWDKYLTLDDMQAINDMIIPAKWYPLELLRRLGNAVLQVFGQGRPETARQWGRDQVARIPPDLYKSFFDKNDPPRAVNNYINVNMRVFDFLRFKCQDNGERSLLITALGEPQVRDLFPELGLMMNMMAGAIEEIARRNGARNPRADLEDTASPGYLAALTLTWS
jgi:hypothetical protein